MRKMKTADDADDDDDDANNDDDADNVACMTGAL